MKSVYPEQIICLSDETTEVLYLLGEEDRIAGISCFTVRPPEARKVKPIISSFTGANIKKIVLLKPDLILGFSDLQADIVNTLIKLGLQVHVFNQRTVQGILEMILMVGSMVGSRKRAEALITELKNEVDRVRKNGKTKSRKPIVYFEEWDEPIICGIGWVSELIEIGGGMDCFAELAKHSLAQDRMIPDHSEVIRRKPDIIIGSWCGRKFRPERVKKRKGWEEIPAVRNGHIYEIRSSDILQPGPGALTDGLRQLHSIILNWRLKN